MKTPDEINAAIAESLGAENHPQLGWMLNGRDVEIPNYHGSLDAIVPVVRALPYDQKRRVTGELFRLTRNEYVSLSTPAQWCEAYLKSKGLWK